MKISTLFTSNWSWYIWSGSLTIRIHRLLLDLFVSPCSKVMLIFSVFFQFHSSFTDAGQEAIAENAPMVIRRLIELTSYSYLMVKVSFHLGFLDAPFFPHLKKKKKKMHKIHVMRN